MRDWMIGIIFFLFAITLCAIAEGDKLKEWAAIDAAVRTVER